MNPAEDAETLAEALRVLSGRWSIASAPAVTAALIPLALQSLALSRLALAEGIPPTSFRAEMRLARAVVDESMAVEGPEGLQELRMLREPPGSANGLSRAPQGPSEPRIAVPEGRSGLDSPDRGVIAGGHRVTIDNSRVEN